MSAGTAYSKRYAGGFADGSGGGSPIDSNFLNAVETALLQLIGSAPTADGQVAQWDFANTRFGPALLLNKNIDPAAAIAKSKLDLTGANGIVNADIAGAAAIARSKLDFGSGLVNADIAAAAAIALSKLAGYPADATKFARGDGTWAAPTGLLTLVYDNRLAVDTASWDVTGIPGNPGDDLIVQLEGRSDQATAPQILCKINNDATLGNYSVTEIVGAAIQSWSAAVSVGATYPEAWFPGTAAPASNAGVLTIEYPNYANTDWYKLGLVRASSAVKDAGGQGANSVCSTSWASTAAITRLTITPSAGNFKAGSRLTIWRRAIA